MSEENYQQEFNEGHIIEGLDRCHTIMVMIEELLTNHPAIIKADMEKKVGKAAGLIMEAYQSIGALDE